MCIVMCIPTRGILQLEKTLIPQDHSRGSAQSRVWVFEKSLYVQRQPKEILVVFLFSVFVFVFLSYLGIDIRYLIGSD